MKWVAGEQDLAWNRLWRILECNNLSTHGDRVLGSRQQGRERKSSGSRDASYLARPSRLQ